MQFKGRPIAFHELGRRLRVLNDHPLSTLAVDFQRHRLSIGVDRPAPEHLAQRHPRDLQTVTRHEVDVDRRVRSAVGTTANGNELGLGEGGVMQLAVEEPRIVAGGVLRFLSR